MAEAEDLVKAAALSARNAKRAAVLALLALVVAVVVLAIDNGIKRAIVEEAQRARGTLDEFKQVAGRWANGATAAGETRTAAGGGNDTGNAVDDDARAPAEADGDAGSGVAATVRVERGSFGGPRGDGN